MNLSRIDNGVDSFELRLWFNAVMTDLRTVTILKYTNSTWSLNETQYWYRLLNDWGKHSEFNIDSSVTKRLLPQLTFLQSIDSIKTFRLDTIITQYSIPNFRNNVADGIFYTIEISTKDYYRRISYSNPKYYSDPYDKQISRFLDFMNRNFKASK